MNEEFLYDASPRQGSGDPPLVLAAYGATAVISVLIISWGWRSGAAQLAIAAVFVAVILSVANGVVTALIVHRSTEEAKRVEAAIRRLTAVIEQQGRTQGRPATSASAFLEPAHARQ